MATGRSDDPIVINPTSVTTSTGIAVTVKLLRHYFMRSEFDVDEFVADVSPLIHPPIVNPGECFAFTVNTGIVFQMNRDEEGAFYFVRLKEPGAARRYYVTPDKQSRPWVPDVVGVFKGRVREMLNPFSELDKFME
jgi:hypothetical protein